MKIAVIKKANTCTAGENKFIVLQYFILKISDTKSIIIAYCMWYDSINSHTYFYNPLFTLLTRGRRCPYGLHVRQQRLGLVTAVYMWHKESLTKL